MNTRKLLVSMLLLVCILLSACTPAAMPTATLVDGLTTFSSKVFELPMALSFGQRDWHVSMMDPLCSLYAPISPSRFTKTCFEEIISQRQYSVCNVLGCYAQI
jgi:hypothetical protein